MHAITCVVTKRSDREKNIPQFTIYKLKKKYTNNVNNNQNDGVDNVNITTIIIVLTN